MVFGVRVITDNSYFVLDGGLEIADEKEDLARWSVLDLEIFWLSPCPVGHLGVAELLLRPLVELYVTTYYMLHCSIEYFGRLPIQQLFLLRPRTS